MADPQPQSETKLPKTYTCGVCGFKAPFDKPNHDCYWVLREARTINSKAEVE